MTIVIETPVTPHGYEDDVTVEPTSNATFLDAVLDQPKRYHYTSSGKLYVVNMPVEKRGKTVNEAAYDVPTTSLAVHAIHQAFAAHVPLSLRPDTLWYFIVHEVAEHVRQNSGKYGSLFTDTPESKQTIKVRDDSLRYDGPSDWTRSINLVRDPLVAKITDENMSLFLPRFSTSTIADETALLVALMDVVSPYYDFKWYTKCGIPQIRLEGSPTDWRLLYSQAELLARKFNGLTGYFGDLLPVLEEIANTADGATPSQRFWRSIYKQNSNSGGVVINGWLTAFFAHAQTGQGPILRENFDWRGSFKGWGGFRANQFPSHVSKVPFIWDYLGTEYSMGFAAGVTSVGFDDNFLSPRLGFAVIEI